MCDILTVIIIVVAQLQGVQASLRDPEIGRVAAGRASSIKILWFAWLGLLLLLSVWKCRFLSLSFSCLNCVPQILPSRMGGLMGKVVGTGE